MEKKRSVKNEETGEYPRGLSAALWCGPVVSLYGVAGDVHGFYVDVETAINDAAVTDFYLFHITGGVKLYMIGEVGECDIEELILANVDEYIELYKEDYF